MLLTKTLFKGNYIKKLHNCSFVQESFHQVLSVSETSIDLFGYEYDEIIKQYIKIPIHHQDFFFIIFDSAILNNELILLTSCGLVSMVFKEGKWMKTASEILNFDCQEKDKLMYLTTDEKTKLCIAYSNTNLFFIFAKNNNSFQQINKENYVTSWFINNIRILSNSNNTFTVSILEQKGNQIKYENLFYDREYNSLMENQEMSSLCQKISEKVHEFKSAPFDVIMNDTSNYILMINDSNISIYKKKNFDFLCCSILNKVPSIFINSLITKDNFLHISYDSKYFIFFESEYFSQCTIKNTEVVDELKEYNSIALEKDVILYYNFKGDMIFVKLDLESKELEITFNIVTKWTNENMFCFDSCINSKDDSLDIYGVCGLKGDSRLVKYVDGYKEEKLKEIDIGNGICKIALSDYIENSKFRLFTTSTLGTSSLYLIDCSNLSLTLVKNYHMRISKIFTVDKNNFILVFNKSLIFLNVFEDLRVEDKVIFEIKDQKEKIIILSHFFKHDNNYLYFLFSLTNELAIFNINNKEIEFITNFPENYQISEIGHMLINNMLIFFIGTYDGQLTIMRYNFAHKKLLEELYYCKKYNLYHDENKNYLIAENIEILDDIIFISSRVGEICVFKINKNITLESNISNEAVLEYKYTFQISNDKTPLIISQVSKTKNNLYVLQLYSYGKAYCFKTIINEAICQSNKKLYLMTEKDNYINSFYKFTENIYLYQNKTKLVFSFFSSHNTIIPYGTSINNNSIMQEVLYKFPEEEVCKKIILVKDFNKIVCASDDGILYLFDINEQKMDRRVPLYHKENYQGLKVHSLKNPRFKINDDDPAMNYIMISGEYTSNEIKKGVLYFYEIKENDLVLITHIPTFPRPIFDSCLTQNFIVVGMENYLAIIPYEIDGYKIIAKQNAKQQQYLNKIISISPIANNEKLSNVVIIGDITESFQLLNFEGISGTYEIIAADIGLRQLAKIEAISETRAILLEKTGVVSLYERSDELYEISNSVDFKEFMSNANIINSNSMVLSGILGSLIHIKKYTPETEKELGLGDFRISDLIKFQKDIFSFVTSLFFGKEIEIEQSMQMNHPVTNTLMLDTLVNICEYYKTEIAGKFPNNFEDNLMVIQLLVDDLWLNIKN